MNILIACERSGILRDAFIRKGHNAISCDLMPSDRKGPHIVGDVRPLLKEYRWDMVIAHPPCTRLCVAGYHWIEKRDLYDEVNEAARFFIECQNAKAKYVAVENPVMHEMAIKLIGRKHDFMTHPWEHGHPKTKYMCWWVKNLNPIEPTNIVELPNGEEGYVILSENSKTPGRKVRRRPSTARKRARMFTGIADALADQWGRPQELTWKQVKKYRDKRQRRKKTMDFILENREA